MYCMYQDREELEDDLYQEDKESDSEGSEVNSELEFHLYSQLHYSSNAGVLEEQEDKGEEAESGQRLQVTEEAADVDGEQEHTGGSRPVSPSLSDLQQKLKKKRKRLEEKQKRKSNPPLSSSVYEEVIVIDSSTDVISISEDDTADDDQGVCALKGHSSKQLKTSTPAQQRAQTKQRGPAELVTLESSSSESDSEASEPKPESDSSDSSESSDSDGLENWMILGREKQDGDQSIKLNLEGESDSNQDAEGGEGSWVVSDKDKEAQIYNRDKGIRLALPRTPSRYYTAKNVQCRNCNRNGHLSKSCPEPRKLAPCFLCGTTGHLSSECPNRHCNNCGQPGHVYDSCTEKSYWNKACHRCNMRGHYATACPEIWRQYHITTKGRVPKKLDKEDHGRTPAYCYNCAWKGHFGYACSRQRMFNGTFPSTPFINHYDTYEDIKRRQHAVKLKAEEMRRNGLFLSGCQTPVTPGPPKKKQKLNYHKNLHTPHRSPNNHTPSRSHIFFNDNHDFSASGAKTKKSKQQESSGNVKPWKPKRPVPSSRDPPAKLILDEADDFPRGGKKGEMVMKKNKKKLKKKTPSGAPGGRRDSGADRLWTATREMPGSKKEKGERGRKKKNRGQKIGKQAQMYPTDENLFSIKQRKRSR